MNSEAAVSLAVEPLVLRRDDGAVATLTLNRPKQYNALSLPMIRALRAELDALATDEQVRLVVLAAAGPAFCAGHDLKEIRANYERSYADVLFRECSEMMLAINRLPQPVIARVQGIATAAGCQLVATCDLAVAVEQARFATSGINVGLFCGTPGVALSRNLARKPALEMLLTGEFIDAPTALARGLVNRVVPEAELDAAIAALAQGIVSKPRSAIAEGKRLFYRQLGMGLEEAYQVAGEAMTCMVLHEDVAEGIDAFIGKRPPRWGN